MFVSLLLFAFSWYYFWSVSFSFLWSLPIFLCAALVFLLSFFFSTYSQLRCFVSHVSFSIFRVFLLPNFFSLLLLSLSFLKFSCFNAQISLLLLPSPTVFSHIVIFLLLSLFIFIHFIIYFFSSFSLSVDKSSFISLYFSYFFFSFFFPFIAFLFHLYSLPFSAFISLPFFWFYSNFSCLFHLALFLSLALLPPVCIYSFWKNVPSYFFYLILSNHLRSFLPSDPSLPNPS